MADTRFADMACALARAMDRIGDPWTFLILRDLFLGVSRFDEIAADLGISRALLTKRLREMELDKLVTREAYQVKPLRHEYRLGPAGVDLIPILIALTSWGERWGALENGPPLNFRHSCGSIITPRIVCSGCNDALTPDSITVEPGPGGRAGPGTQIIAGRLARGQNES